MHVADKFNTGMCGHHVTIDQARGAWAQQIVKEDKKKKVFHSLSTTRLCVRDIPQEVTEEQLNVLFSQFGTLSKSVRLVKESPVSRCISKGLAFVQFDDPECARQAVQTLRVTKKALLFGSTISSGPREPLNVEFAVEI